MKIVISQDGIGIGDLLSCLLLAETSVLFLLFIEHILLL